MVLLQDIALIDRQITNLQREITNIENILEVGATRGQRPGCNVCSQRGRANSQDCAICKRVNEVVGQLGPLTIQLQDLQNEKSLITPPIQDEIIQIIQETPIDIIPQSSLNLGILALIVVGVIVILR